MRSIEDIIDDWKIEFGTSKRGAWGEFFCIDFKQNKDLVYVLAQIMVEEGYKKDALMDEDGRVNSLIQKRVVDACEGPTGKSSRKASSIKVTKDMTAANWRIALKRVFLEKTELPTKTESFQDGPKKERPLDINPKDQFRMDVSDMKEIPAAEDLLAELAAIGSFVDVKDE